MVKVLQKENIPAVSKKDTSYRSLNFKKVIYTPFTFITNSTDDLI